MERLNQILDEVSAEADKIGLYYRGSHIGTDNPELASRLMDGMDGGSTAFEEALVAGEQVVVLARFSIGDQAFHQRVVDPEQHQFDVQAQAMLPTPAEALRERIQRAIAEGRDPFDEDDIDEPEED